MCFDADHLPKAIDSLGAGGVTLNCLFALETQNTQGDPGGRLSPRTDAKVAGAPLLRGDPATPLGGHRLTSVGFAAIKMRPPDLFAPWRPAANGQTFVKRQAGSDSEKVSVPEFVGPGRGVFLKIIINENSQRDALRRIVLAVELRRIIVGQGPKPRCRRVIRFRLVQTGIPQKAILHLLQPACAAGYC